MTKPITFAQFHEAAGSAVAAWGAVEDALCQLFTRLVIWSVTGTNKPSFGGGGQGTWVISGIFYGTTNLNARMEMIDRIVQRLIKDDELKAEWAKIKDRSRTLYGRRNLLAHGQVWGNQTTGASAVAYSIFDESRRLTMSYQQACAQTASFKHFHERIESLADAMQRYLGERGIYDLVNEALSR